VIRPKRKESERGVWGFSHTRFGGPGEKTPKAEAQARSLTLNPGGSIVGDSRRNTSVFSARFVNPGRPNRPEMDRARQDKEQL
jgi:hypothetical protein